MAARGKKTRTAGGEKVAVIIAIVCVLGVRLCSFAGRVKTYLKVHFRDVHSFVSKFRVKISNKLITHYPLSAWESYTLLPVDDFFYFISVLHA
jgi:hypothetical protein